MSTLKSAPVSEHTFTQFLFHIRLNRVILYLAASAIIIQFVIFKFLYPFPNFIHGDSFSYINAAYYNLDINTYMVGYSRFLRLFSVFTTSDTALVAFQYLLIQCSSLFLLFTIFYFHNISKVANYILISFIVLNPLLLHLGNLVSSDCLFASLSLIWFATLLWIIHRPNNQIIYFHSALLFLVFTVRYNALIYPLIAALAFWLSPLPLYKKFTGLGLGLTFCCLFIIHTGYEYKKLTGSWQYSPFSGWQLANNAMYIYRYIDSADRKPVPQKFEALDKLIKTYFDSTRDVKKFPTEAIKASTVYMWTPRLPLMKYSNNLFKKDTSASNLKVWSTMGPLYKSYGLYIIRNYPVSFIQNFIWPNMKKYYAPPIEFLERYNSNQLYVPEQTKKWFEYKSQKLKTRLKNNEVSILNFYPILSGITNIIMVFTLIYYSSTKKTQTDSPFKKSILLGSFVWLINAGFTISASSVALRFQSFPILVSIIIVVILIDWIWKLAVNSEMEMRSPLLMEKAWYNSKL